MSKEKITYKDIISQKEYLKMIIASLINRFGDSIDAIASTWIVYQLTSSAAWSAIVYAVNTLPTVIVTPLAGVWVEGRNKKKIMIYTDLIRGLVVACVATLLLFNRLQPWMLIVSNLIISTVEAFRGPAGTSVTPMVLKKDYFEYGMSLMSSLSTIVQLIGMGCAAGIISLLGISGALYIDLVTFMISALIICFVNTHETTNERKVFSTKLYITDFVDGIKYVSGEKVIVFFFCYTVFLNAVLVPLNSLQAPMTSEVLNSGVEALSVLAVAFTVGSLVGSVTYPMISKLISNKIICLISGLYIGIYYLSLVFGKPFYSTQLSIDIYVGIVSFIVGYVMALAQCLMSIIFMKKVNKKFIARASAISTAMSSAALPIMSFLISLIVAFVNIRILFIAAGVADFVVVFFLSRSNALEEEEEEEENKIKAA